MSTLVQGKCTSLRVDDMGNKIEAQAAGVQFNAKTKGGRREKKDVLAMRKDLYDGHGGMPR